MGDKGLNWPQIGLGTGPLNGDAGVAKLTQAIRDGYRLLDTAALYGNEREVGEAVRASGVPRDEIIVLTKVWVDKLAADDLRRSAEESLRRLGMDSVDLFILHWPNPLIPMDETIEALNKVQADGLARQIGVSNFTTGMMAEARQLSIAPLVANEIEYHPYLNQDKLLAACKASGMAAIAHCPLGRVGQLFAEAVVTEAAARHGKSPAQVVLRWHIQQNVIPIPGSTSPARLKENLDVFDFTLDAVEMAAISALEARHYRICTPPVPFEFDA
ncbi:MAG TPA: aldo/keto reductase [Devosiaceae bacterium]|jgi:diketogulonate reductase-like aldo/keto reductase